MDDGVVSASTAPNALSIREEARQTMGARWIITKPVLMDESLWVIDQEIARRG